MVSTKYLTWALACGIFNLQAHASSIDAWEQPPSVDARSLNLVPVREEELFPNLRKRADDLSRVHPQNEVRMFFGKAISENKVNLANLTVTQPDTAHPILLLERFDDLTESITCTNNDTKLALKFRSKDAMDTAIKAWDWVNQNEPDFFFLISHHHHNGCGAQEERTPYKITAVQYEQASLTATLTKQPVAWDETLQNFQLTIGTTAHPAALRKRDAQIKSVIDEPRKAIINILCKSDKSLPLLFRAQCDGLKTLDKALDFALGDGKIQAIVDAGAQIAVKTIADSLDPTFRGESGTASFSLGKDDPNQKQSMTIINKGDAVDVKVAATCTGCFISGNIDYKVFATRLNGGKVDLYIDVTPNVKGKIAVELIGTVLKEVDFNLLTTALNTKLKTLAVGNIITVAPEVANGPGVVLRGEVSANVSVGFEFNTANASVALSLGSDTQLIHRDWDVATASPSFKLNAAKIEAQLNPYWRFGIGFGVDIIGKAKLGAFAGFTAQITNAFTPGACDGPTGRGIVKQASRFKMDLGYKVLAEATTGIGLVDGALSQLIPQPKDGKSLVDHELETFCRAQDV
ncbi:hypothetical protein Dda_5272 [Drechslerella dactyloides]|uniref:DUF7029 domain-containing protein n=1 Tax=Drechslerella dactyloides TaxID=74499 RepID=A0AAD6IVW2_DREDA|nr:hypothetical protein Dda_5272 [Drechslerella dactyloides]